MVAVQKSGKTASQNPMNGSTYLSCNCYQYLHYLVCIRHITNWKTTCQKTVVIFNVFVWKVDRYHWGHRHWQCLNEEPMACSKTIPWGQEVGVWKSQRGEENRGRSLMIDECCRATVVGFLEAVYSTCTKEVARNAANASKLLRFSAEDNMRESWVK